MMDDPDARVDPNKLDLQQLQAVRRAKVAKAIALAVIALLLIIFAIQNARPVPVRLVAGTATIGVIWVVVIAAALGAVGGYLVGRPPKDLRLHGPRRRKEDPPPLPGQEPSEPPARG